MPEDTDAVRLAALKAVCKGVGDVEWQEADSLIQRLELLRNHLSGTALLSLSSGEADGLEANSGSTHITYSMPGSEQVVKLSKPYLNGQVALLYLTFLIEQQASGSKLRAIQAQYQDLLAWDELPKMFPKEALPLAQQAILTWLRDEEFREQRYARVHDGLEVVFRPPTEKTPVAHLLQEKAQSAEAVSDPVIVEAMLRFYKKTGRVVLDPAPANWGFKGASLRLLDPKFAIAFPREGDDGYVSDHSDRYTRASRLASSLESYWEGDKNFVKDGFEQTASLRRLFIALLLRGGPRCCSVFVIEALLAMREGLFEAPVPAKASDYCVFSKEARALIDAQVAADDSATGAASDRTMGPL